MIKKVGGLMILTTVLMLSQGSGQAQSRDRSEIPEKYKWDLSDLYQSDDDWELSKDKVMAEMEKITEFQGKVTSSAATLLEVCEFDSKISKELTKLYIYAARKSDEDTRDADNMARKQTIFKVYNDYGTLSSFIQPELVKVDKDQIEAFIKEEPKLQDYRMSLMDIQRRKAHKLSENEEKILAEAGMMASSPSDIYEIFSNAEMPYPQVVLSTGDTVTVDLAGYTRYRALENREDREKVFEAFWGTMNKFKQTYGAQLYSEVKKDIFYAKSRKYDSSLQSALDANNIPVEVYHKLIENVNNNLDYFHRYLKIKKRMLGVDTLKYSDLYAPTVKGVDLDYDIEEAYKIVLETAQKLGPEYQAAVENAIKNRWIDVYPSPGKRSGAYSSGDAYDDHPYILLNYNGKYDDVSTLAHELGHTMHSYFSNKNQPYPTADYSIFVAEVASTLNEALLIDKVLKEINNDDVRLSLLMEYLDGIKGTVFRQTQFAEYELKIHELAEEGKPLTGDVLTEVYSDILKKYYGDSEGICKIEPYVTVEWAYIPHFYYNFYVYQYATSFTASTALAEKILSNKKGAVDDVLTFLSSGGSDYPIEVLKKAGVDMTTDDPFNNTMKVMQRTMDEIEKILDKGGK